jgi:hypothetical protein
MYVIMCVDANQPPSSPSPFVIRLQSLERGNERGHGYAWGSVHLVMGVITFWTPIESRAVHALQDIFIFVKYFEGKSFSFRDLPLL